MIWWLRSLLPPRVPKRLTLAEAHYFLDGGTTVIQGTDEQDRQRSITLTQQMLPRESWFSPPIGRLYIDGRLVPLRSLAEAAMLAVLEASVAELRMRPAEPMPASSDEKEGPGPLVSFGSSDLAELAQIQGQGERMAWMVNQVIDYVRSDESGQLRGSPEPDSEVDDADA
jgi:hypothetical protein